MTPRELSCCWAVRSFSQLGSSKEELMESTSGVFDAQYDIEQGPQDIF